MGRRIFMLAVLGGGLAGCGARDLPVQEDDLLVLELGGNHKPLRKILRLADPEPGLASRTVEALPAIPTPLATGERAPARAKVAESPRAFARALPEPSRYFEVTLQPGQTLYELCRLHLGDPGRWREVMKLNGLQEAELRRLPTGKKIRLPRHKP